MISVGISKEDRAIRQLAADFLQRKIRLSKTASKDLLLFSFGECEHFDIAIENTPSFNRFSADIRLLNSDTIRPPADTLSSLIITYGLNHFATATASSLSEESSLLSFQYCLQRALTTFDGHVLECQEFPVSIPRFPIDIHRALAFVTLALICDVSPKELEQIII